MLGQEPNVEKVRRSIKDELSCLQLVDLARNLLLVGCEPFDASQHSVE
jgi:hypothetical protein